MQLRQPQRNTRNARRIANAVTMPPPVGGWNARDPLTAMPPTDAIVLENWIPDTATVKLRNGFASFATGLPDVVESLMEWAGPASVSHLIAASDNAFYNVTLGGAVGAAMESGHTNSRWQHSMFATPGGNFLYTVNGADSARYYDGSTWTTPVITGATSSEFVNVMAHQQRLFFIEKDSLTAHYLDVNSISGAAGQVELGSLARKGGYLVGLGSWTLDGGGGQDDQAVFITSEGEVFVFSGTDPSDADNWAMTGRFAIGRPIGNRCVQSYGADLIVICEDGFYPLSRALITGLTRQDVAISDKISGAVREASMNTRAVFGWQGILYPRGRLMIFNVPTSTTTADQYVMNTITGAWTKFTDMNAFCWSLFAGNLYFGGDEEVFLADSGTEDDEEPISSWFETAFNNFGQPVSQKRFVQVQPQFRAEGNITPAIAINTVPGNGLVPSSTPSFSGGSGSPWDTSPWDSTAWSSPLTVRNGWQSVTGVGAWASLICFTQSQDFGMELTGIDYVWENGEGIW